MAHTHTESETLPPLQDLIFPRAALQVVAASAGVDPACSELGLRDELAARTLTRLRAGHTDFSALELRRTAERTLAIDVLARNFLASTPGSVGVGVWPLLGARGHRLEDLHWVDVDAPEVAKLRRQLLPQRPGYLQLATCACQSNWIDAVCGKANRRLFICLDESVMPLAASMVMRLLDDMSRRVPSGSQLVMAYTDTARLRPVATSSTLELDGRDETGQTFVARYPRLRFIDHAGYDPEALQPALAHLRFV